MTLMEALVVTAVTVLVGGIAFPNLQRSTDRLAAAQAEAGVSADLRRSRAAAVRLGRPVSLVVTADGRGYQIGGGMRELPAGLTLTPVGARLTFFPDGSMQGVRLSLRKPADVEAS